jgi:LCP family protein required for cell wall assembly
MPVPPPAAQLHLDDDVVNILLLGRDTVRTDNAYRTDVIIVVSINKAANAVTMLTIPRDLFIYIPGWTMNRINTAAGYGDAIGYPGGGVALLEQAILYNLGIPIHYWARVDFAGFRDVVDVVGGVDVPVSCAMQDWRLKDPAGDLQDQDPDHWHLYTVETGVQHMDGNMALWYARSRRRSSDFDRSRRQHQVLRAIFDQALRLEMLARVPDLYNQYVNIVDTDMGLGDMLQFVPLAAELDKARIKSRFIGRGHVTGYTTSQGAAVLLPIPEAVSAVVAEAFAPPPSNVLERSATAVEVANGTNRADWATLAAENLAWSGISPVIVASDTASQANTVIYDYTTSDKNSQRPALQTLFRVGDENVIAQPDPNAAHPYKVVLGADFNSCVSTGTTVIIPTPVPEAGGPVGDAIIHAAGVLEPPPGIDGDLVEWALLPYPMAEPIFGTENWEGPTDGAAVFNAAWDEEYLYLALDVNDTTFVQTARGELMYQGDSLELWFDVNPTDNSVRELNDDDFQLGISPGDLTSPVGGPEAYLWHPLNQKRAVPEVVIAPRLEGANYALEVAIPWVVLGVTPQAGTSYGFALALNDDDTPGSPDQQTQVTNDKGQLLTDPTTWGTLVLDSPP